MSDDWFKSSVFSPEEVERRKRVEEERKKSADAAKKARASKAASDSARAKMNAEIAAEYQKALNGEQSGGQQQIPNLRRGLGLPAFSGTSSNKGSGGGGTPLPGSGQPGQGEPFKLKRW